MGVAAALLTSCAHRLSPKEFDTEIRRVVPVGTAMPVAISVLENEGLLCRRVAAQECTAEIQRVNAYLDQRDKDLGWDACSNRKRSCGWEAHVSCQRPIGFSFGLPHQPDTVKVWDGPSNQVVRISTFRSPARYAIENADEDAPMQTVCKGISVEKLIELRRRRELERKRDLP